MPNVSRTPPSITQGLAESLFIRAVTRELFKLLADLALDPPPSSSLAEERRLHSLLLRAPVRDSRRSQLETPSLVGDAEATRRLALTD